MKYIWYPVIGFICSYIATAYIDLEPLFWNWSMSDRIGTVTITAMISVATIIGRLTDLLK